MHYKSKVERDAEKSVNDKASTDSSIMWMVLGVIAFIVLLPIIIPLFVIVALICHTLGIAIKEF